MDFILGLFQDIQPGRLTESLIFLFVMWWKVKPHLKMIEDRMLGMEKALENIQGTVKKELSDGESRFNRMENRIEKLETLVQH